MHIRSFMSRKGKSRETILDFSLVAPLTSISRAFSKIVECSVDFQAGQIIFEGSLTKEECRNVILDIMCFDDTASEQIKTQDSTPVIRRYPFTLEAILLALEPRQLVILPHTHTLVVVSH